MKIKKNTTIINIIASILLQLITIIYGFLIPKIIISYFGSEVNGLVSSISQLLSYIALIEGGITAIVIARLYNPLTNNNTKEISSIIATGSKFFHRIGLLFAAYSIILAAISPLLYSNYGFSSQYTFTLTLILSIGSLTQYTTSLSLKCLLQADKKMYYISITQILIIVLNIVFAVLSIKIYPSIHLFKFLTGITYLVQPIMYKSYAAKRYRLDKKSKTDSKLLKERWNGFANNLAYFIHSSTDITILTFASNLVTVSVYGVYALVTSGLKSIIGAINTGSFASIGHLYAQKNIKRLQEKFDIYEFIYLLILFISFTVAALLITPFVFLYIGNNDINSPYTQYLFGYLIVIAAVLDLAKVPHVNLAYAANKFKELTIPCFIEAIINITVSIILVIKLGLVGVAIGTICAMTYRIIYQIHFTSILTGRAEKKFYKVFIAFSCIASVAAYLCTLLYPINTNNLTVYGWIMHAIVYCIIVSTTLITASLALFREQVLKIIKGKE